MLAICILLVIAIFAYAAYERGVEDGENRTITLEDDDS